MGRENSDQAVVHSSIALLQERFRQLQRVKEMREERELLRLFSSSSDSSETSISPTSTACNVPPPSNKLFYHPELIIPPQPTFQSFHHFLRTESRDEHADYLGNDQKGNTDFFAVDQKRNTDFFCVDEKRNTDFFHVDQKRNTNFLAVDTPLLMSLWPTDRNITRNSNTFDDSDVDTSLHL